MSGPARSPWLAEFGRRPDPALRLVALPYAGGRCTIFREWAGMLDDDIELLAVQYPGRGARASERPLIDAPTAADQLASALEPLLDRPYAIFGHCLGALIGFELARVLTEAGNPPRRLLVGARQAPHLLWQHRTMSDLPASDLVAALSVMGGTPVELLQGGTLVERALPSIRADLRMEERYQFIDGPPLPLPISTYGGRGDKVAEADLMAWSTHSATGATVHWFDGGHFFLDSHRRELVQRISADLGETPESTRPFAPVTSHGGNDV